MIQASKVQLLMQARAPLGAIGDIVDDAVAGDVDPFAALAVVTAQIAFGESPLGHGVTTIVARMSL